MLVEEVMMDLNDETLMLTMTIHWKGGVHTQVKFKKPVNGDSPPNKTGAGNLWNRTRVRGLRVNNQIAPFDRRQKKDVVSLNQAAKMLNTSTYVVRRLIKKGYFEAKQVTDYAPFEIERSDLGKESVKEAIEQLKCGRSPRNLSGIEERQLNLF